MVLGDNHLMTATASTPETFQCPHRLIKDPLTALIEFSIESEILCSDSAFNPDDGGEKGDSHPEPWRRIIIQSIG